MSIAKFLFVSTFTFLATNSFAVEKTPVSLDEIYGSYDLSTAVEFLPPKYEEQDGRLGYGPGAFSVPTGMEQRVSFWLDIYTKYSTDQGLLHDSEYVELVYEEIDFRDIMIDEGLTDAQKRKARRNLVKESKKRVKDRLKRLARLKSSAGLEGEDLRYWYLFQKVEEKNKFLKATRRGRLRFQLGQSDRFVEGIYHSGKYIRQMEDIFREANLPIELTRMVYVESSFNPKARSKVGASGIWQFMRSTAKQYMRMDASADERNDPLSATRAAAKKLTSNFEMLGSWPLAVTGYNHGPSGVRRLVKRFKTEDLAELTEVRRGRFGFASANFYASFLAALEAEKNALKYYGEVKTAKPIKGQKVKLDKHIKVDKLVSWFDGNLSRAKEFNLHLHNRVWRGDYPVLRRNFVRVPTEKLALAQQELKEMKTVKLSSMSGMTHKVRRGETLSGIAMRYGVRQRAIMDVNGIANPRRLRAGQKILIP